MATGDVVLVNYGTHNISGASLKAVADTINLGTYSASGGQLYIIPTADGAQAQLLKVTVTGW